MQKLRNNLGTTVICLGILLSTQSCADNKPVVEGTVTHKGQPLTNGEVRFFGPDNQSITALIGSNGTYVASGCELGATKVAVVSINANAQAVAPLPGTKGVVKKGELARPTSAIPERYGNPETSHLSYVIKAGIQKFDITLGD